MDHLLYDALPLLKHGALRGIEKDNAFLEDVSNGAVMEQSCKSLQVMSNHMGHFGLAAIVEIAYYLLEVTHQDFVLGSSSL